MMTSENNPDLGNELRMTMLISPLSSVLSNEQKQKAIESDKIFSTEGLTAVIYSSDLSLSDEQLKKLSKCYGDREEINNQWLIKKPRSDTDKRIISNLFSLYTDFSTSQLEWIRPLTAVSTMVENNKTGERVLLIEQVKALSFDNESDRQCLDSKDLGRAIYQTLMIGHSMNEDNCVAGDFGKEIYFLKNENPPRVIVFDLASPQKLPPEGKERAKKIVEDQNHFLNNLKRNINKFNPEASEKVMKVLFKPEDSFRSLMEIAKDLNEEFGGEFEQEYLQIEKQIRLQPDTTWSRFTMDDVQKAQTEIRDEKQKIREEAQKDEDEVRPYLEKIGINPKNFEFDPESEVGKRIIETIKDPNKLRIFQRLLFVQISLSLNFESSKRREELEKRLTGLIIINEQVNTKMPDEDNKTIGQFILDEVFPENTG